MFNLVLSSISSGLIVVIVLLAIAFASVAAYLIYKKVRNAKVSADTQYYDDEEDDLNDSVHSGTTVSTNTSASTNNPTVETVKQTVTETSQSEEQAVMKITILLSALFSEGPSVWSYTYTDPVLTTVSESGKKLNTKELSDRAIQEKRSGMYTAAIEDYYEVILTCRQIAGKVPIAHCRGLFKVLVCANYFRIAQQLAGTVYADIQQTSYVDPEERMLFNQYFKQIVQVAIECVDHDNFDIVKAFAANYSGSNNYVLNRSRSAIESELKEMLEELSSYLAGN